ncbi:hypothetical protein EDB85DRAFT_1892396 [Lactarius pseudohatsudake]|nr:hypothetical protein EDB85DRAFT_1898515 [Lactarius pseudohatsudake]KAH9028788.1 hypothetical protein EDB85DRAFT_1892396 [Lactarius pseudohatsudake]
MESYYTLSNSVQTQFKLSFSSVYKLPCSVLSGTNLSSWFSTQPLDGYVRTKQLEGQKMHQSKRLVYSPRDSRWAKRAGSLTKRRSGGSGTAEERRNGLYCEKTRMPTTEENTADYILRDKNTEEARVKHRTMQQKDQIIRSLDITVSGQILINPNQEFDVIFICVVESGGQERDYVFGGGVYVAGLSELWRDKAHGWIGHWIQGVDVVVLCCATGAGIDGRGEAIVRLA